VKLAILLLYVAMVLRREPKKREKPARFFEVYLSSKNSLGAAVVLTRSICNATGM
jgi:hypothetical protein